MPGCCAPYCSNSSQKGYRLYHFPADPERCALWVKNCGREWDWQPTKHSCVCGIHFEESQFESHRADGLKKLKPFAIPTKFNKLNSSSLAKSKKRNVKELQNKGPDLKTQNIITSKSTSQNQDILNNENLQNVSEATKPFLNSGESLRKNNKSERNRRKQDLSNISVTCKNSVSNVTPNSESEIGNKKQDQDLDNTILSNKGGSYTRSGTDMLNGSRVRKKSCDIQSSLNIYSPSRKCNDYKGQKRRKCESNTKSVKDKLYTNEMKVCFICNQNVEKYISLSACTETSKITLDQKLMQLIVQEFDMLVDDSGILCDICAQTLNCIDYIESVLHTLNKGIVNLVKKKFGMKPTKEIDLSNYIKYLKNLNDFYCCKEVNTINAIGQKHCEKVDSNHDTGQFNMEEVIQDSSAEKQRKQISSSSEFECQICAFKTPFNAILRYHLRQHCQNVYSCDFCSTSVVLDPRLHNEHVLSYTLS